MAIVKEQKWRMQVDEWAVISVQRVDQYIEDGTLVTEKYHRFVLGPGDDTSAAPQVVQDVAATLWTQARIDAYAAHQATLEAP